MSPVYIVMCVDRHAEPDPEAYADREAALSRARHFVRARQLAHDRPDILEEEPDDAMLSAGWLYYASWNSDGGPRDFGDFVFVAERKVQT